MEKVNTRIGVCRLCKLPKELSFEHIPPKSAFNRNTRYYSISNDEYYKIRNILDYKPKGMVYQGGMGTYCLCKECNSFLGRSYVKSYQRWANIGMALNQRYKLNYLEGVMPKVNPFRILKQIISMIICINDTNFTDLYPELIDFVKDPSNRNLPDKYQVYAYLNSEGQYRKFPLVFTNDFGIFNILSEFAYPPFGYVLHISKEIRLTGLTNITSFKNCLDKEGDLEMEFYKHPTYYAMPLDYRRREEFEEL